MGSRLHKTTNLSAHLITVPAILPNTTKEGVALEGMGEETIEEIARGILRCLKRRGSPSVSKVHLVLPPEDESDDGGRCAAVYDDIIAPCCGFSEAGTA